MIYDSEQLQVLSEVYRDGLLEDMLPFWLKCCVDEEHGGFMMSVDRDGTVIDTDKSVWQQGRFTWLMGELYNEVEQREDWLRVVKHGVDFMDRYCFDEADGRMWFHLTREGRPIRKRRYAFGESFAAIAYGEYAKAAESDEYQAKAVKAFEGFVNHNLNPQGVVPKFTDTRSTMGLGFPMITIVTAQELRASVGYEQADEWIERSIETIEKYFVKDDLQVVMETVGKGSGEGGGGGEVLDHFEGRMLNPGHAIEGAWFIMNEGKIRGDSQLVDLGLKMLDYMWARGWDEESGGILYFVDLKGLPVQEYWHDMKFWWPQNETIIATLLAYQLTGDEKYARMHQRIHDWTYERFPDEEHGEWYGYLHRDGRVSVRLKGNLWKGPFHAPRMKLVCWQLLEEMLAAGQH